MTAVLSAVPADAGPFEPIVAYATDLVTGLAVAFTPLAGANATAVAIIAVTVVVRLLLSPLTWLQIRAEVRRAALAPQLAELRGRYVDDPQRLAVETMTLYRSAGASPFAGCLPALAAAPVFILMYHLVTSSSGADGLLAGSLFGVGLGTSVPQLSGLAEAGVFGLVLALLAVAARATSRRMRRSARAAQMAADGAASAPVAARPRAAADGPAEPSPMAVIGRLLPLLPYGTVLVALVVPLAAGLYLATTTTWTVLEQSVLRHWLTGEPAERTGGG
ncbi:membrane protein insertase YidC [Solwaraspora sp. WMMD791]|uniref:YidC/Oxa1 family membrane protein insertase n=1 Tax=Solwaraspora sp. WMMD791 TaxID=3016086 RepID=UPI00249CC17C|nr:membrane protein insertase YidC [Solwaraspora sp. WMMD791]WFE26995.1 membrane protein insertase YidC [Solwaraspora sp. WMMD791]